MFHLNDRMLEACFNRLPVFRFYGLSMSLSDFNSCRFTFSYFQVKGWCFAFAHSRRAMPGWIFTQVTSTSFPLLLAVFKKMNKPIHSNLLFALVRTCPRSIRLMSFNSTKTEYHRHLQVIKFFGNLRSLRDHPCQHDSGTVHHPAVCATRSLQKSHLQKKGSTSYRDHVMLPLAGSVIELNSSCSCYEESLSHQPSNLLLHQKYRLRAWQSIQASLYL